MRTILLSGFYISPLAYLIIFAFIVGGFCLLVAIAHFFIIKKTSWFRNSTMRYKSVFFTFISTVLVISVFLLGIAILSLISSL